MVLDDGVTSKGISLIIPERFMASFFECEGD
jgi:hypothetical protein